MGCGELPPRYELQLRMRRVRLRVFLVALLVDRQMARLAPVHLRHADEVHVVDDVGQDDLLNLDGRRHEVQQRRVSEIVLGRARRDDGESLAQPRLLRRASPRAASTTVATCPVCCPSCFWMSAFSASAFSPRQLELARASRASSSDALLLLRDVARVGGARGLEVVAILVVGCLRVLHVERRAVQRVVRVLQLRLQLVDLLLVRGDVLLRRLALRPRAACSFDRVDAARRLPAAAPA